LRDAVTDHVYHCWLEPLRLHGRSGDELFVAAPPHLRGWVSDRYQRVLQTCAAAALGPEVTVTVVAPGLPLPTGAPEAQDSATLNPQYTFSQFVIGGGNHLAHSAALAVAEMPGQAYNPLFLYGAPGVGKTHLLHSIANYIDQHGRGLSVRYVTGEQFTNEFVQALQRPNGAEDFKRRYRRSDVLLVDDVQFLERKARTEAEFFHTFNALYEAGSQLVLASDRLPRDLEALEARLRERFESGLVADIARPDIHMRRAVLHMRADRDDLPFIHPDVLEVIAERIEDNIRVLVGALIRVVAHHSLTGRPLTPSLTHDVLDALALATRPRRRTVREIQDAVCEAFEVSLDDLLSPRRTARVAHARQVAMYLARELTDGSLPSIGREFGNRNHSTVLHAHRSTTARIARDPETNRVVADLSKALGEGR
jgi:chromosomal replication initiator protein